MNFSRDKKGRFLKDQQSWNKNKRGLQVAWNKGKKTPKKIKDKISKRTKEEMTKVPKEKLSFWKGVYKGGVSSLIYKEKLAGRKKPGFCEVCGISRNELKKDLCFDHDHKTGKFRGWICHRCNVALGMVKDKVEILELLIKYLKKDEF